MKYNILKYIFIIFLIFIAGEETAWGKTYAKANFSRSFYDSISALPAKQLFEKGMNYLTIPASPDSALLCFNLIINKDGTAIDGNMNYKIASYLNLGYIYQNFYHDYALAYANLHRGLDMSLESGSNIDIPYAYMGMASILDEGNIHGDLMPSPAELLLKSFPYAVESDDAYTLFYLTLNLISIGIQTNNPKYATGELKFLLNYKYPDEFPGLIFLESFKNGYYEFLNGNYEEMDKWFEKATEIKDPTGVYGDLITVFALETRINSLILSGKIHEVPSLSIKMLEIASDGDYPAYQIKAYKTLHRHYKENGDSKLAKEYEYEYLRFMDSIHNVSNIEGVKEVEFITRLDEINGEVMTLNYERKKHIFIIILISIAVMISISFLLYFIRVRNRLRETNRLLYQRVENMLKTPSKDSHIDSNLPTSLLSEPDEEGNEADREPDDNSNQNVTRLDPERSRELYEKTLKVMSERPEVYSADFSIKMLGEILGEPYYELSIAINDCSGSNFKTLLSETRIREACVRLKDPALTDTLTMEGIAGSLGFKSRTYFNSVFKKYTGLTPTQYMKTAREEQKRQNNSSSN